MAVVRLYSSYGKSGKMHEVGDRKFDGEFVGMLGFGEVC